MATGRASKDVVNKIFDWTAIVKKVPASTVARSELNTLRAKHEQLRQAMMQYPEQPKTIDWNFYRNRITAAGFVDQMEKAYKDLLSKVPYPPDKHSESIAAWEKKEDARFEEVIKQAKFYAEEIKASSDYVKNMPAFEDIGEDEFFDYFPTKYDRDEVLFETYQDPYRNIEAEMFDTPAESDEKQAEKKK